MLQKYIVLLLITLMIVGCENVATEVEEISTPVTVLMYHHFEEGEASGVIVDPVLFREQLIALKEAGYTSISEKDLYHHLYEGKSLPKKPLFITIDDGYLSNYELAYPILAELEMYATIYVVGNSRGKTPGVYPHFTWEQAKEMYESGWIEIQSHTHDSHFSLETIDGMKPVLANKILVNGIEETDSEYRDRVRLDLELNKQEIEYYVGNEVFSLAFPYGAYNQEVIDIAKELGFLLMYTVKEGYVTYGNSPYEISRFNVSGTYSPSDLLSKIEQIVEDSK